MNRHKKRRGGTEQHGEEAAGKKWEGKQHIASISVGSANFNCKDKKGKCWKKIITFLYY